MLAIGSLRYNWSTAAPASRASPLTEQATFHRNPALELAALSQGMIDRQPAIHRVFTCLSKYPLQQLDLLAAQALFEGHTVGSQFQQAFALVGLGRDAAHQGHLDQLA